jgi:hypothetical protein
MIASLASGDVNAHQAFLYLSNHQSKLNLGHLFEAMQLYVNDFQASLRQSDSFQVILVPVAFVTGDSKPDLVDWIL